MADRTFDDYPLGRNFFASSRLNISHFLWKQVVGANIHDSIPQSGSVRIADVATGTGLWPLDVAAEHPDAEVDAFDIELDQCAPSAMTPSIRKLERWDIFQTPPEHLAGVYDIVHIRLVIFVLRNQDPTRVVRNLSKLLKPGGWLQWDELDIGGSYLEVDSDENPHAAAPIEAIARLKRMPDFNERLRACFLAEGLQHVRKNLYRIPRQYAKPFSDMHLMMEIELSTESAEAKATKLVEVTAISEASQKGVIICTPLVIHVAQKPS